MGFLQQSERAANHLSIGSGLQQSAQAADLRMLGWGKGKRRFPAGIGYHLISYLLPYFQGKRAMRLVQEKTAELL